MYDEVTTGSRRVDGITFPTRKCTINNFNILSVEAGTTGLQGGDSGHGCRTFFSIKDEASTDIKVKALKDYKYDFGKDIGFEVRLGGDAELKTVIEALKFIVETLEGQIREAEALEREKAVTVLEDLSSQFRTKLAEDNARYDNGERGKKLKDSMNSNFKACNALDLAIKNMKR